MTNWGAISPAAWRIGDRGLTLDRARLMGILNVTPDSFSDGGLWIDPAAAVRQALRLVEQGADIIDIGGESTRPGAQRVPPEEQIRRVEPVILALRARSDVAISIDTTRAAVARAALDAGADIINDVAAGEEDPEILPLAAARRCGLILMHRLRPPDADRYSHQYAQPPDYRGDVVGAVCAFLRARIDAARAVGVKLDVIVADPGLGFGKSVEQNFELVRRMNEFAALSVPALCAASRKSFISASDSVAAEPSERDAGSVAVAVECFRRGIRLFRVHDVASHRQALTVAAAVAAEAAPSVTTSAQRA